jgi:hypothetical protein
MSEKRNPSEFCLGTVTVITSNNLVITGMIKPNCDDCHDHGRKSKDEDEFVTFTLTAPLLAIPGSGLAALVQPFYVIGDTIRLNINQVETVGPSHPTI